MDVTKRTLGDDLSAVRGVVDDILHSTLPCVEPRTRLDVRLGLLELAVNAVEHGILSISHVEKNESLARGCYDDLLAERRERNKHIARRASVLAQRTAGSIVFEVVDDGDGFDWCNLSDPTEPAYPLTACGRGIYLAAQVFDELFFNDIGNRVTAVRYYVCVPWLIREAMRPSQCPTRCANRYRTSRRKLG